MYYNSSIKEMIENEEGAKPDKPVDLNERANFETEDPEAALTAQCTQVMVGTQETNVSPMTKEWKRFEQIPHIDKESDVLAWWSMHEKQLPLLARVVKKYFCVQASSCSSERTFSAGGQVVTAKRNKLDPHNVNLIVYIKENVEKVKIPALQVETAEEEAIEKAIAELHPPEDHYEEE